MTRTSENIENHMVLDGPWGGHPNDPAAPCESEAEERERIQREALERSPWYLTFGIGTALVGCYVECHGTEMESRAFASKHFKTWCGCYSPDEFKGQPEKYALRCIQRVQLPNEDWLPVTQEMADDWQYAADRVRAR